MPPLEREASLMKESANEVQNLPLVNQVKEVVESEDSPQVVVDEIECNID